MPPHSSPRSRDYNPYNYSDSVGSFNKSALKEAMFDDDADQFPDGKPSKKGICCYMAKKKKVLTKIQRFSDLSDVEEKTSLEIKFQQNF